MALGNLLLVAESNQLGILSSSLLRGLQLGNLLGHASTLALKDNGGDEALDLGSLGLGSLALLLGGDNATNDNLADIILLGQVEELAQLASTLGTQTTGDGSVSESGNGGLAGLGDDHGEDSKIGSDDATADRLALALTTAAFTEALVSLAQKEANTVVQEDTLHHGETLFVVSTGDLEDVALPLVSENVSINFLGDALVVEGTQFALIDDLDQLLTTSGWVSDVELDN